MSSNNWRRKFHAHHWDKYWINHRNSQMVCYDWPASTSQTNRSCIIKKCYFISVITDEPNNNSLDRLIRLDTLWYWKVKRHLETKDLLKLSKWIQTIVLWKYIFKQGGFRCSLWISSWQKEAIQVHLLWYHSQSENQPGYPCQKNSCKWNFKRMPCLQS